MCKAVSQVSVAGQSVPVLQVGTHTDDPMGVTEQVQPSEPDGQAPAASHSAWTVQLVGPADSPLSESMLK